jgi:RND family efflux transporter MFP subunit
MKNRTLQLFIFACAVIIISCKDTKDEKRQPPPPQPVNVYVVEKGTAVYYDPYPATVTAINQVDLRAQVTGYITGIYFKDGQHVTKGQKLYDIDRQQYLANYDQAVANLNVSKANLEKAQQDADRYNDLLKQDAIAKQVYDHAVSDLQSAKMQVQASESNVRNVETTVKYSSIYASFDGTIGISLVKMGALVTANQTLLNTISSVDPMAVDVQVDQREIPRFIKLQQNSTPKDSIFTLQLPDNSIYNQTGSISFIDRSVNPQTGTIKVRLVFSNSMNLLKDGMNTNVRIKNNNTDSLFMLIPYKAVTEQMGEYFVFVVNDSSKAIQHKISLGAVINDKVVVKNGLNEGDKIVTDGAQKLKDSSNVQVGSPKNKT